MISHKRTAFGLVVICVGLGLSVLAQEIGDRTLMVVATALGSACTLFGAYAGVTSVGRPDPASPWFRRGRRFQWIGGLVFACGVGLGVAMFLLRPIDDIVTMLFIGMIVSLALGTGLFFIGLSLRGLGVPQPVVDYAKEHPYPSHEDRATGG